MKPLLTFVHISDSHIGPDRAYSLHGVPTLTCLEQVISLINALPEPPDFVLHTGDVSTDRSPESYAITAEALSGLQTPVYYVRGNHDDPALMREMLDSLPHASGDRRAPLDYTFSVNGERFLVLDACSEAVPDPQGHLTETQLEWVRAEVDAHDSPLTVLLHYPLFPMASPWLNANMLVDNGADLHRALLPARDWLRGVFLGHMHRSCQLVRDGITYTCAGSTALQYQWRPWDDLPVVDEAFPPSYNIVQYSAGQVIVHQYTFSVG